MTNPSYGHTQDPFPTDPLRVFLIAITITLVLCSVAWGKPGESFMGTGTAVVLGDDQDSAISLAQPSAVRKAVSQAIESMIQKGTKEELQYNIKRQELLKGPFPFVTDQRVVGSERQGKLLRISVEIQVDSEALLQFLGQQGILAHRMEQRKRKELPPIMVLVTEEINGKEHKPSFWLYVCQAGKSTWVFQYAFQIF